MAIADSDYYGVGWMRRAENLGALEPPWLGWSSPAQAIWIGTGAVVVLLNRRRRSVHDFIADTVVISTKSRSGTPGSVT